MPFVPTKPAWQPPSGAMVQRPRGQQGGFMGGLQGLLQDNQLGALGAGLLSASGYSHMPQSIGQGMGQGFQNMQRAKLLGQRGRLQEQRLGMEQQRMTDEQQEQERMDRERMAQQRGIGLLMEQVPPDQRDMIAALVQADPKAGLKAMQGLLMPEPEKPTSAIQNYQQAVSQGFTGSFMDYQKALKPAGTSVKVSTGPGMGRIATPDEAMGMGFQPGSVVWLQPGEKPSVLSKPDQDAKRRTDAARVVAEANPVLAKAEEDPEVVEELTSTGKAAMRMAVPGQFESAIDSPAVQKYKSGAREWIGRKLGYQSGATVPEPEFQREYSLYFPMPGDTQETVKYKRNARERARAVLQNKPPPELLDNRAAPPIPSGFVPVK